MGIGLMFRILSDEGVLFNDITVLYIGTICGLHLGMHLKVKSAVNLLGKK